MASVPFLLLLLGVVAVAVFFLAVAWIIFNKAGYAGWLSLIPIVNMIFWLKIAGRSGWLILLFIVPIVNCILALLLPFWIADKFGKSFLFGLGLLFLPIIFYPILAFGSAQYVGAKA